MIYKSGLLPALVGLGARLLATSAIAEVTYHFEAWPGSYGAGVLIGTPGPFTLWR